MKTSHPVICGMPNPANLVSVQGVNQHLPPEYAEIRSLAACQLHVQTEELLPKMREGLGLNALCRHFPWCGHPALWKWFWTILPPARILSDSLLTKLLCLN